jgi:RNA polymerase sigma factor (sigma-70 family)
MPQRSDDQQLLNRYLLGVASDDEREMIEEQYFEEGAVEELFYAEDELIDDYIRGTLTTPERVLFEKNFLCTIERRQRTNFTKDLLETLVASKGNEVDPAQIAAPSSLKLGRRDQPSLDYDSELFGRLLRWLDPVHEKAAQRYERIRRKLIQMFALRGFVDAEDLADKTIDRVARRAPDIMETYVGDPAAYFYGVARMMLHEYSRRPMLELASPEDTTPEVTSVGSAHESYRCLEKCLRQLSESNRQLILQYYSQEKENKVTNRKDLAHSLGISLSALRIRAQRIRASVQKCVIACLEQERSLSP